MTARETSLSRPASTTYRAAVTSICITARDLSGCVAPVSAADASSVLRHLGLVPTAALHVAAGALAARCKVTHFDRLTEGRATVRCGNLRVLVTQDFADFEPACV